MAVLALLAGCAQAPVSVSVPVAVSCVPRETPAFPVVSTNAELSALDDGQLVLTIAAERLDLLGYAKQAEAVIRACR